MEKQYSGDNSSAFWEVINMLEDFHDKHNSNKLYGLGCDLQNLEDKMFREINKRKLSIYKRLKDKEK